MLETHAKLNLENFLDELAQSRKAALLLDYDGTLAPFRVDRHRAFPYPGVPALLQEIINTGHTRVVLITGRPAQDIVPLLGLEPHPEIWGAYGLQRLRLDGTCAMPPMDENVVQALAAAAQWLNELGFSNLAELKPGSVAVHWRGLEDSVATRILGAPALPSNRSSASVSNKPLCASIRRRDASSAGRAALTATFANEKGSTQCGRSRRTP